MRFTPRTSEFMPSVPEAIQFVARLDEQQYLRLKERVASSLAFSSDQVHCEHLAQSMGLHDEQDSIQLASTLSALDFLRNRLHTWTPDAVDKDTILRKFLISAGLWRFLGEESDENFKRLSTLLGKNEEADRQRKHRWLESGLLENVLSFASFVEVRPNFSDDRKHIDDLVPIILVELQLDTQVGSDRSVAFQLTESGFAELRKLVDDIDAKLTTLKADERLGPILTRTDSEE